MVSTITISKAIPSSNWYSGNGSTTLTLYAEEITVNTKRSLIKIPIPQSSNTQDNSGSDTGRNYVKDLKRVEDTIKIRGWIPDTTDSSAWTKAWKLRAMCAGGSVGGDKGAVTLVMDNITCGTNTQQAFLEEFTFIAKREGTADSLDTTGSNAKGIARVEFDSAFYLGDAR